MSQNLHVIPVNLVAGQKFDKGSNTLTLKEAGAFFVTIREYAAELKTIKEKLVVKGNNRGFQKMFNKSLKPGTAAYIDYKKKEALADQEIATLEESKTNLVAKYANVKWCWQLFGTGAQDPTKITHNEGFAEGIADFVVPKDGSTPYRQFNLSKLLEGGGYAWLEVFTKDDIAIGKPPHGFFVRATGVPKILRTEWTDFDLKPITETVGLGSKVLLNIYTEGLYGQELDIELKNYKLIKNDSLQQRIIAEVNTYKLHSNESGKTGIDGNIRNATKSETVSEQRIQKAVIEVTVNAMWMKGDELEIFPVITNEQTREEYTIETLSYLKVNHNSPVQKDPADSGNRPLMVGQVDTESRANDSKKTIDFTFGIFIDGTLNNLYNSESRQKFEKTHGVADNQKKVDKFNEKKYRYIDESSYENDLSNPAIIFQNYIEKTTDETHPVFKVYTEGIGTETKPNANGNLEDKDYKNDDMIGYGLGTTAIISNTGIKKKVRQACEEMAKKIVGVMKPKKGYIVGTITVDVFGFSRGAAAARNFVHEITYHAYDASYGIESYRCDQHGYTVSPKYFEKTLLPANGHLGYMLAESEVVFKKLDIRFAGLYDTVPHHGLSQANDAEDLGLHSIDKANYVVHMAAGDEHRKNFSLVKIGTVNKTPPDSGKKGGIELFMPGVHCDVGGSYVDEKPDKVYRIDAFDDYSKLEALKDELVAQGWFKEKQAFILNAVSTPSIKSTHINKTNHNFYSKYTLNSERENVSNQYSFIPLRLMAKFCEMKNVFLDKDAIKNKFPFTDKGHIKNNVQFLDRIQQKLHAYAFDGGQPLHFVPSETFSQPVFVPPTNGDYNKALMDYLNRQKEGQEALDKSIAKKNEDIMFLRNNHLHWNSKFGYKTATDIATQPHAPHIDDNGKRKRTTR